MSISAFTLFDSFSTSRFVSPRYSLIVDHICADNPVAQIVSFLWTRVVSRFDASMKMIERSKREFEEEARLAHDLVAAKHRLKVETALPSFGKAVIDACFLVPFQRNRNFFVRRQHDDLTKLHEMLQGPMGQRSCTVHGSGGLGKIQLALEYCYRYALPGTGNYKYCFWIRAQDDTALAAGFSNIPRLLGRVADTSNDVRQLEVADQWLRDSKSFLSLWHPLSDEPGL